MKLHRPAIYFKQLTDFYQTAFALNRIKKDHPFYRIIKLPDDNDKNIFIQIVGKASVLKMLPQELMRTDLLLGFSRPEIAIIAHLGTKYEMMAQNIPQPNRLFKILKQIFKKGKTLFIIEKNTGEVLSYQAHELYRDASVANHFSGKDGMKIGYAAAEDTYKTISDLKMSIQEK